MHRPRPISELACALILTCLAAAGCQTRTSDRDLVFVDPPDAEELLSEGRTGPLGLGGQRRVTFVDPRTAEHYAAGHIEGAISVPFPRVSEEHRVLKDYDVIIVYGDDYNDAIADAMSKRLIELKHGDVRTLRGGLRAWTSAGHALVND